MTNFVKVSVDKKNIVTSDIWKNDNGEVIKVFKYSTFNLARRVLTGQLSEPILDRLAANTAPSEPSINLLKATSILGIGEFWERLMELEPIVDEYSRLWEEKHTNVFWKSKSTKDRIIVLTPKITQTPVIDKDKETEQDTVDRLFPPLENNPIREVEQAPATDDLTINFEPINEDKPDADLTKTSFRHVKIPANFSEYKGHFYGKNEGSKYYSVLDCNANELSLESDKLGSSIKTKRFIDNIDNSF